MKVVLNTEKLSQTKVVELKVAQHDNSGRFSTQYRFGAIEVCIYQDELSIMVGLKTKTRGSTTYNCPRITADIKKGFGASKLMEFKKHCDSFEDGLFVAALNMAADLEAKYNT
jgi:hypothetical protein